MGTIAQCRGQGGRGHRMELLTVRPVRPGHLPRLHGHVVRKPASAGKGLPPAPSASVFSSVGFHPGKVPHGI